MGTGPVQRACDDNLRIGEREIYGSLRMVSRPCISFLVLNLSPPPIPAHTFPSPQSPDYSTLALNANRRDLRHSYQPRLPRPFALFGFPFPAKPGKRVMDTLTHTPTDRKQADSGKQGRTGGSIHPKPYIVVSVVCVVPVARGGTQPVGFVVPRTTTQHTAT